MPLFYRVKSIIGATPITRPRKDLYMEKIEYYTLRPNLKQIYGKKVTKDTTFNEKTEDGTVTQEFKNLTLITKINKKNKVGQYEIEEKSEMKVKVPEGTILIWDEQEGFIVPQYQMCTLDELQKEIEDIQDIYKGDDNDTKGNENKDI